MATSNYTPSSQDAHATIINALTRFGCKGRGSNWQCPAHEDNTPSLSVSKARDFPGVVLYCHAGCPVETIVKSLHLTVLDLFDELHLVDPVRTRLREHRDHVRRQDWPHRTGRTDKKTYLAIVDRALIIGQYTVTMSQRELAALTGAGNKTSDRALHRLQDKKVVQLGGRQKNPQHAQTITLRSVQNDSLTNVVRVSVTTSSLRNTSESFCTDSGVSQDSELGVLLGDTGRAVYRVLTGQGATVQAIADHAGVARSTASRKLSGVLLRLGMAKRCGRGWVIGDRDMVSDPYDPEAESFGGPIVARRHERWAKDREEQKKFLVKIGKLHPAVLHECVYCGKQADMSFIDEDGVRQFTCNACWDAGLLENNI